MKPVTAETLTMRQIAIVKETADAKLRRRCERLERHDHGRHYFDDLAAIAAAWNARNGGGK